MSTRWLTLTLLTVCTLYSLPAMAQQTGSRDDSPAEESRGPGRFFRKLREDFSGRKDEEEPSKTESSRTADRREPPAREGSGFQPLFSPPAFLGGASSRSKSEQETEAAAERGPFKFSQPTLPPPVANTLPRPSTIPGRPGASPSNTRQSTLPPPASRSVLSGAPSGQSRESRSTESLNANSLNANRQLELPSGPIRQLPKPSLEKGFGFELTDREDGLYVATIAPRGNADQAELKKGDQILKIGGVDVEQKQQFEEIAEMLENGDQIEIVYARRGKESDVLLQFGEPPAADTSNSPDLELGKMSEALPSPLPDFKLSDPNEIPDFAPPASESSRYQPGVTELTDSGVERSSRQPSNGFRSPTLPAERKVGEQKETARYSEAELLTIIRQQQDAIRQLQFQVQQLRLLQERSAQPASTSRQRSKR